MNVWKLFPERKEYEVLKFLLRRHIITFVPKIILFVILLGVPLFLGWFLNMIFPDLLVGPAASVVVTLSTSTFYLFTLVFFLTQFNDYFLDVWIVTNERIIDIEIRGLFSRTVSETRFYRVQDVTSEMKGFFATIFNYGNVYIQTAGSMERFIFRNIPRPVFIAEEIMKLIEADKPFHGEKIGLMNNLAEGPHVEETSAHAPPVVHSPSG